MTTTEAIADLIHRHRVGDGFPIHNAPDLLARWTPSMETQVNVNRTLGTPIGDTVYGDPTRSEQGVYVDASGNRFWNIRIPRKANTPNPEYQDRPAGYPLPLFVESVGMTGWDWQHKVSRWVGFDFDAITGHAVGVGIDPDQLQRVKDAPCSLPYVEVRASSGGQGLHLYVLTDDIPTESHTVHATLARCILKMMSEAAGFDFASRIDACGGNMWVISAKATPENGGFRLLKSATESLTELDLPDGWRDVITSEASPAPELTDQQRGQDLDRLRTTKCPPQDRGDNTWKVHAADLRLIDPSCQSFSGGDPSDGNAWIRPNADGSWHAERYNGTPEHSSWRCENGRTWTTLCANRASESFFADYYAAGIAQPQPTPKPGIKIWGSDELESIYPEERPQIVEGIIRRGEVWNLISASKVGKSWLALGLAMSIATGKNWLGRFPCTKSRVLLLDNELHSETLSFRIRAVREALGLPPGRYVDVITLRGEEFTANDIQSRVLDQIEPGKYDVIIVDALYKMIPSDIDENSNSGMSRLYARIDKFASATNATWVIIHHSSKGSQAEKDVMDVGAGAGAMARACDHHMVLRHHKLEDHLILEGGARSIRGFAPVVIRREFPLWVATEEDPNEIADRRSKQQARNDEVAYQNVLNALKKYGPNAVSAVAKIVPHGDKVVLRMCDRLVAEGLATATTVKGGKSGSYNVYEVTA